MIKLTEIYQGPVVYDEESEKNVSTYNLREVYINPEYITYIKSGDDLHEKSKRETLVQGLHGGIAYTHIIMHNPGARAMNIDVVGSTDQIIEKLTSDKL